MEAKAFTNIDLRNVGRSPLFTDEKVHKKNENPKNKKKRGRRRRRRRIKRREEEEDEEEERGRFEGERS